MAEGNSIERMIRLLIGVEGAQDAARAVERVGQSADRTEAKASKLQKAYKGVAKTLDFVADASSMVVAAQIGVQQAFQALGISGSQRQLADYSRALLESRQQFAKYNESLVKTERRVLMLKDRFAFTRQEILGLQAAFDKGFSFQAPQRMVQVFDTLRDVVGENVDAMQRLQSSIQQIGQKVPIYQELFSYGVASRSEKISKSARNMSRALLAASAIAGDITLDELKEQLGVMAQLDVARGSTDDARRQAAEAQARTDQLNQNIRTLNELRVLWEDILMKVAEGLQPALKTINNLLQAGGERLENIVALGLKVGSIFAAIGAVNFASSIGKLATSMTSGLGFLANMGGGNQGPMQGPTGLAGNLAGMFGSVGSMPTKPMYVVIVGDMTVGGTQSPLLWGPGGAKGADKAGRFGKIGRLAGTVGRFALPALAMGATAYGATSLAQNTFAGADDLSRGSDTGAGARAVGGLAAGVGGGAAMGAAIGTFIMPGLGTAGGAALGAGIGAVVSGLKMLSTQLETTSEAAKKANDAYAESLNKRKMFAANEAEYDLADFEMQRKQILDQIQAEESKAAKLSNNLFGVEGFGWGGPDEKLLEDLNKQREMLNRKIRTARDEVREIEEGQERQTQEISASDKALIGFVARYQLLNSFIQISNRRFDAAIGKLDAMTSLLSQFRGASPLGEGFDSDAAFDNAMAARQRQLETISAAQGLISQFQNTINSMDIDGVDSDGEWIETMRQAVQDIPNIGEVISDEIMQKVADVGSAAQLKDVMATVADEIATARIKSIASFEKIFDTGLQTFEGERNLTASAKDLVSARVGLADSLAAGVAASAEMRMDQVRAIQAEIGALNKQIEFTTKFREEANAMLLEGQRTNNQEMINEGLLGQQMAEEKLNQLVAERLSMMTEQANITKSIRDGYVDAIAAMSTGAGMFTQIVIDQNKNLGQLQAGTNNRVVSLRSGAMARGLETSERYTPFGIMSDGRRFGASDEVNKLITESNPLAQFFSEADVGDEMVSTISESGAAVVEIWQQEAGRFFSTAGSALQNQRYGSSELQDMITNRGGQPATIGNPDINVEVEAIARNTGGMVEPQRRTAANRDGVLAALTPGEGVLTQQAVAQNGGPAFVDSLNSGLTVEGMAAARAAEEAERETVFQSMLADSRARQAAEDRRVNAVVASMKVQTMMNNLLDAYKKAMFDSEMRRATEDSKAADYDRMSEQLDHFNFQGSSDMKSNFIYKYPGLWYDKLYGDADFFNLSSVADVARSEGRYVSPDEYEAINKRYLTISRRLSNLRYLLPTSGRPQQEISRLMDQAAEEYDALMSDRNLVSERMTRLGTDPNPLMFEGNDRNEAELYRNMVRASRGELQDSIDEMNFAARANQLSMTPLGVRVPDSIADLIGYSGPTMTRDMVTDPRDREALEEWTEGLQSDMGDFSDRMKARMQAMRGRRDSNRGAEQLRGWKALTSDLISRGMPYEPKVEDLAPGQYGPPVPGQNFAPTPALQLTEEDQAARYAQMRSELDRRKEIITNRMIAWRQDQADAIMRQLASAESAQAKAAIVAQLEDFDINTQDIYEKIESARYPAQLDEILPLMRGLGVRGLGADTFARPPQVNASPSDDLSMSNLIGEFGEINEGIFAEANASGNPAEVYLKYMRMPIDVPPKKMLERIDEEGKPVYMMEAISDDEINGPNSMKGMMAQRIAEAISMPAETNDQKFAQFQEFYDIQRYLKQLALGRDSGRISRNRRMLEREAAVDDPARRLQFLSQDGISIDPAAIQSQKDAISNILREDSKDDALEGLFIHNIQAFRQLFDQVRPIMAGVRASIDQSLLDSDLPDYPQWPSGQLRPIVEDSYARGGIAAPRPGGQLARIAEAGKSEAIVPLPDGNSIPVMFQNDSASMSGMPEPIMNSINTSVNAGMDTSSEGLMNRGGSQKVEFEISGNDRKRITDDLVAKIAAMVTRVVEQSEQRVLDDMQVRG